MLNPARSLSEPAALREGTPTRHTLRGVHPHRAAARHSRRRAGLLAFLALLGPALHADTPTNTPPKAPSMTCSELRQQGITTFLDKEFTLKARVTWEYLTVKIPENPTPDSELRQKAGPLRIRLEGAGFPESPGRMELTTSGRALTKKTGADHRELYAIQETALANQTEYVLKVRLKLRPAFDRKMLENPAFVKQCDDPRYWSQLFELELLALD